MKKLLAGLALIALSTTTASAHGWEHGGGYRGGYGHYENHYHGGGWGGFVGPALIGGIIGYELGQPRVYQPAPVIIQQPQVIYQQPGVYSTIPPGGYHYETILDGQCNCYRTVLVQN
jgi:hypothetical protein